MLSSPDCSTCFAVCSRLNVWLRYLLFSSLFLVLLTRLLCFRETIWPLEKSESSWSQSPATTPMPQPQSCLAPAILDCIILAVNFCYYIWCFYYINPFNLILRVLWSAFELRWKLNFNTSSKNLLWETKNRAKGENDLGLHLSGGQKQDTK